MKEAKAGRAIKICGLLAEWREVTWKDGADMMPVLVVSKNDLERIMRGAKAKKITVVTMAKGHDANASIKATQIDCVEEFTRIGEGEYERQSINLGWSNVIEGVKESEEKDSGVSTSTSDEGSSGDAPQEDSSGDTPQGDSSGDTPQGDSAHIDYEFFNISSWFVETEVEERIFSVVERNEDANTTKESKEREESIEDLAKERYSAEIASYVEEEHFTHEKVYDSANFLPGVLVESSFC